MAFRKRSFEDCGVRVEHSGAGFVEKIAGSGVAVRLSMSLTSAGVRFGFASSINATAPATCGAENDVPVAVV